jgi:hypothetical protein
MALEEDHPVVYPLSAERICQLLHEESIRIQNDLMNK